ncbi:aldehyde dehydrogenase family 16 member A1-like [Polyodon spathula]|uniref:aldehyde dehydrogenase family 16 member A1-like n=1 Tax=Polyodon spathula TaxID=7913 RepID=UPI001B7E7C3C|nr:aldehyde dehydrogenase family 16 member A1-like [Polyodon spathula]
MSGASASSAGRGVNEIFDSMEYGPAKEDGGAAQAWLERHARSFGHFIYGRWVKPEGRESYPSKNPATGQSLACTVQGCSSDVSLAVKSSREAFVSWSALPCHARARHLYSLTRTVQKHQSLFSVLESLDHGKPVQDCRNFDVPNVIRHLYYHAGWAERRDSEMKGWRPLGVVAAIVSSESPLVTLSWKVCPALAMGNTVVLKPDTRTRLSALLFAEICAEAGLPLGVVNVVTGDEDFGAELAQHPDVDKVDFTGSAERGRALCRGCAGSGKALSLRLGARSPCIVFDSADLDSAVEGIVDAAWSSAGQARS